MGGIGGAANGRHFTFPHFGAALRRGNLCLALANDHNRVAIGMHFNPEYAVVMGWMNGNVGCIDLGLGLTVFGNRVGGKALS